MKPQVLLRQIHRWGSILIALPLAVMIGAGLLLMLKKDIDWIQPPTQQGVVAGPPAQDFETLLAAAQRLDEIDWAGWDALDRIDVRPGKGIVKFVGQDRWEVQVDLQTAEVLQVAYRRSDLIESLHDGSFFASWTKLYLFFPAGLVLLGLWGTGLYLFFLPHVKKWQKAKKTKKHSSTAPGQPTASKASSSVSLGRHS